MVRPDGSRVHLSTGEWIKIGVTNVVAVGSIILSLWTKLAVVENEIDHLKTAVEKIERRLEPK
jgi:hypothetical protein